MMPENPAVTLTYLVRQVKTAIRQLEGTLPITEVELQIQVVLTNNSDGVLELMPVTVGGTVEQSSTQTISLTLIPDRGSASDPKSTVADELRKGIQAIHSAVRDAADEPPKFGLKKGEVTLRIGVSTDGKIKIFGIGASRKDLAEHTVTLRVGQFG
jgi:hypothetical protein